ncbi:hypothetical protein RGT17_01540 [Bacillus altitudinis]|nr:hypothetical protein [Bacillus pumilus]MDM5319419.1 hypothetical protein [Bacillus pumilus]MDR4993939.1 hypothetical protein [Bacillus altitudinis]
MNQNRDDRTSQHVLAIQIAVIGSLVEADAVNHIAVKKAVRAIVRKKAAVQRKVRNHAKVKSRAKARNLAEAKRVSRKNHAAANTDPIIRKTAASLIAATVLKNLITIDVAALAKDVERKSIIPAAEEMFIANGIKGTCGSIAVTAKHQIIFFETLFKREYDKKGFFLFHREVK